jgi:hypothetical protein
MWGTNAILLVVGGVLTLRLGREGTTAQGSETLERLRRLRERFGRRRTLT